MIPQNAKGLLKIGHVVWVATIGADGWPNVAIKGSGGLIDDETIYFADAFAKKTHKNLLQDSRVAVGVYNSGLNVAVQFKGHAKVIERGEFFDQIAKQVAEKQPWLPPIKYVVQVRVESVWDMSAGPHGGDLLT